MTGVVECLPKGGHFHGPRQQRDPPDGCATEPIVALTLQCESEMNLKRTAAEVGYTPDEFRNQLKQSATLARSLGALEIPGGTIQRQVFTDAFAEIIRHLGTATPQRQRE